MSPERSVTYVSGTDKETIWSGREDLNLRPPGPEPRNYKLQGLYLVSLRRQQTTFSLAQLYRSCTEYGGNRLELGAGDTGAGTSPKVGWPSGSTSSKRTLPILLQDSPALKRFLHWYIYFRPISEIAQCDFAGAACVDSGPYIKKPAQYVVMHPRDLGGFLCALPRFVGYTEIEIHLLAVVDDAQTGAGCALFPSVRDIPIGKPHTHAFGVQ